MIIQYNNKNNNNTNKSDNNNSRHTIKNNDNRTLPTLKALSYTGWPSRAIPYTGLHQHSSSRRNK